MPGRKPVVELRINGLSQLSSFERELLVTWLMMQMKYVEKAHLGEMPLNYTARRYSLYPTIHIDKAREPQKESLWSRLRKWAGTLMPKRNSGAR